MNIIWNVNPKYTTLSLTELDKQIISLVVNQYELIEEATLTMHYVKNNDNNFIRHINYFYDLYDKSNNIPINKNVIYSLTEGYHEGDCTCLPATCQKCYAEEMLNINTLKGISKHSLRLIDTALINENNIPQKAIIFLNEEYHKTINNNINQHLKNAWINQAKIAAKEYENYLIKSNI